MIKFKYGSITNPKTGVTKDIVVKSLAPNHLKDALIGGAIVLGGIAYLTVTAFRNGAEKFDAAEYNTFEELGLITDKKD